MKKYKRVNENIPHFASICPEALRRLALVYSEGDERYGRHSWTNVDDIKKFRIDTIDHAMNHLNSYLLGDKSEDHLAKVVWGMNALIHHDSECRHQEVL